MIAEIRRWIITFALISQAWEQRKTDIGVSLKKKGSNFIISFRCCRLAMRVSRRNFQILRAQTRKVENEENTIWRGWDSREAANTRARARVHTHSV